MPDAQVHILGIRHHGPGSARSVCRALEALQPDAVLIEGPPDADATLPLVVDEALQPPVALLVYVPDEPRRAAFYPFAAYSPEWQAARYAVESSIDVRFIDLPQQYQLVEEKAESPTNAAGTPAFRFDPLSQLATAAGFSDGERWWDHVVESRRGGDGDVFAAVREAMCSLRSELSSEEMYHDEADALREQRREAHMRRVIRETIKSGKERIAVVCGAWHVPALVEMPPARHDSDLLKGLKKVKTDVAWSPWTYDRLAVMSGYGAGVRSPEWYHLLWEIGAQHADDTDGRSNPATVWLTRVARLMRERDLDASSAHVIEAVRLAWTLAAMRGRSLPGLDELDEAALTVICNGEAAPMQMIRRELIVGRRIGSVPDHAPMPPLQRDLQQQQKSLRLKPTSEVKDLDLDLRKEMDLARSHLLHRLNMLGITWGALAQATNRSTGTFHEHWQLQWEPSLAVALMVSSRYGPTVAEAATARATELAQEAKQLAELSALLDDAILADMPEAVQRLVAAIAARAATGSDVNQLLDAAPGLARVCRYGNVRQTDADLVRHVLDEMFARACIGLPAACGSLNDDAAEEMFGRLVRVHESVVMLDDAGQLDAWFAALQQVAALQHTHGLVTGRAVRLLYDRGVCPADRAAGQMSLRLSPSVDVAEAAAWLDGFLRGSGVVLIHDEPLFSVVRQWVAALTDERFNEVLPLVRRTFATFAPAERRQMGGHVRHTRSGAGPTIAEPAVDFDPERAAGVLDTLDLIFGVSS